MNVSDLLDQFIKDQIVEDAGTGEFSLLGTAVDNIPGLKLAFTP